MSRHGAKPGAGSVRGAMRPTVGRVARRRAALVGVLSLLVLCVQLALAAPAAAVPFTGGFSPTIIGERADLNGDGVVNGRDDANAFYGDTHIIDGMLDCNAWLLSGERWYRRERSDRRPTMTARWSATTGPRTASRSYVSGGEFQVADGPLPTVFNAADPDNPDVGDSDFAWSAIGGRVDSNGDEAITGDDCHFGLIGETVDAGLGDATDGADILGNPGANECGFSYASGRGQQRVRGPEQRHDSSAPRTRARAASSASIWSRAWCRPSPNEITLEPATDSNVVGTDHTVTATVVDEFGNPLAGEAVHFVVTGGGAPDPAGGDDTTDASGEATFTFTNETAGANTVTACVDADAGSDCDGGELSDTATKTWDRRVRRPSSRSHRRRTRILSAPITR